jgi:hypothetical protein
LATAKSLTVDGIGTATVTLGSEPYSINTESAFASSEMSGTDLTLSLFGDVPASLPQVDKVTAGEMSNVTLNGVNATDLAIVKKGMGTVKASGTASNLTIDADGGGSLELYDLVAETVTINMTGDGGSAEVHATGNLTINISGNGRVNHKGGAVVTDNSTGSGTVTNDDADPTADGTPSDGTDADSEPADATEPADGEDL